jgi:hypothetical protein
MNRINLEVRIAIVTGAARAEQGSHQNPVTPAKADAQPKWVPAFARNTRAGAMH